MSMDLKEAQRIVKEFAERKGWKDEPGIDKFDHIHEELIEMSQHLRYLNLGERKKALEDKRELFEDGIGDVLFAVLRLANQLKVDAERAFGITRKEVERKYSGKGREHNIPFAVEKR